MSLELDRLKIAEDILKTKLLESDEEKCPHCLEVINKNGKTVHKEWCLWSKYITLSYQDEQRKILDNSSYHDLKDDVKDILVAINSIQHQMSVYGTLIYTIQAVTEAILASLKNKLN